MKIIQSRQLGDIVNIVHVEPVCAYTLAISYGYELKSGPRLVTFTLHTPMCEAIGPPKRIPPSL